MIVVVVIVMMVDVVMVLMVTVIISHSDDHSDGTDCLTVVKHANKFLIQFFSGHQVHLRMQNPRCPQFMEIRRSLKVQLYLVFIIVYHSGTICLVWKLDH